MLIFRVFLSVYSSTALFLVVGLGQELGRSELTSGMIAVRYKDGSFVGGRAEEAGDAV